MKSRMILSFVGLVVVLAFAPVAAASNSSVETYGGQGGELAGSVSGGDPSDPGASGDPASNSSALPFTGLDLELLAGGGLILLLGGVAMARMSRTRHDTA